MIASYLNDNYTMTCPLFSLGCWKAMHTSYISLDRIFPL